MMKPPSLVTTLRALVAICGLTASALVPTLYAPLPPQTVVWVNGGATQSFGRLSVGRLLAGLGVHPRPGRLLDLRGGVLDNDATPPRIVVDGRPATMRTRLADGDRVKVSDGVDTTEPTVLETVQPGGGNPESRLVSAPIEIRRAIDSGIVVPLVASQAGGIRVALTFDDGPNPRATPAILGELTRAGVKATFFVIGRQAERYPDLVRREVAAGMTIGDHTWDHQRLTGRPAAFVTGELARVRNLLARFGVHVALFRPPYDQYSPKTVSLASSLSMRTVLWTVDPADYTNPGTDAIVRRVLTRVRPGVIILLHDGGGKRNQTVAALPTLIKSLRARGYSFDGL
jgi:peptidoglycan/xylan/chitin deacetylase (PgdA/CDA1 family)